MTRRTILPVFTLMIVGLFATVGCRTSEANYREAYEKTIAGRDSSLSVDSTIYGAVRREAKMRNMALADGSSVPVHTQHVRITEGGGGINENLRRYNVVVGRFKQLFNARSLRNRLVDGNIYPHAFVVETSEPYYYVVAHSDVSLDSAAYFMRHLPDNVPAMREPLPFILDATSRRR